MQTFVFSVIGSIALLFAVIFIYYALKNAITLKTACAQYLMVTGVFFFVLTGIVYPMRIFVIHGGVVSRILTFVLFVLGVAFILAGETYSAIIVGRSYRKSWFKVMRESPHRMYRLVGISVLLFFAVPFWTLSLSVGALSILSVGAAFGSMFAFLILAIGEKRFYFGMRFEEEELLLLLRDDVLVVRSYVTMLNTFLTTAKSTVGSKSLRDVVTGYFRDNPILFEGCNIRDDGIISIEPIVKNLDRVYTKERVSQVCRLFSNLTLKLLNFYGAMTSLDHAKKVLGKSYLVVKEKLKDTPIVFDILRSLPPGVLEDEKIRLLSKKELEMRVRERTIELEEALEKADREQKRAEELAIREKAKVRELEEMRDVMFSVLEDTNEARSELEEIKNSLEQKIEERTKDLKNVLQELKFAQMQLIQSGKLAALGTLGAGIAHQLNQPLTGIRLFSQMIKMQIDKKSPLQEDLNKIIEQTKYMENIINNIRAFSHMSELRKETININEPIEKSLQLVSEQLRIHRVKLVKDLASNLPKVRADFNQMQQVFLNLITNARESMDFLPREKEKKLKIATMNKDSYVEIVFEDSGVGMKPEIRDRIFEPFFTTKGTRSMGLGLALNYGIIEDHDGRIDVESEEGKGTKFIVKLPVFREKS